MKTAPWFAALLLAGLAWSASAQPSLQTLVTNGLAEPYGVAVDANNLHYITDSANNRIALYNPNTGSVTNLAGIRGEIGRNDGLGVFARFFNPQGIVLARGGLVVADSGNHLIRRVEFNGTVSTLAGSAAGFNDAAGTAAAFNAPAGLAADAVGNVFVADTLNNRIRRIDTNNVVTTVAAGFSRPTGLALDRNTGLIYVADTGTHSIRVIQPDGTVRLFAGSGSPFVSGSRDSLIATNALFNAPRGLVWVGGNTGMIVSDTGNRAVRRVYFNSVLNSFSVERFLNVAALEIPVGLSIDNTGNIPLADLGKNTLFSIQVTAPQAPVREPEIGVVILTTNNFGQLRTSLVPVINSTFNNDVTVAILAERGTDTFYTLDPDANFPQDPASRNTPAPYENGLLEWTHTLISPSTDGSNVTIRAISTQDGRRPSAVVTARFQFKVAGPVVNGKNPGGFTLDNATAGSELWYTTDGSTPVDSVPSLRYTAGQRLNIVDGTNNVTFKVRAFKPGYSPSTVTERLFLFSDLQTSSIGVTRDFRAGSGSTIVVPVEVKLAPGDALRSLQFRAEVTPNGGAPLISTQFRNLAITTNDFIRIPVPSTNAPIATSYSTATNTGLAISFVGSSTGLDLDDSAIVTLLAIPIPPAAAAGQTYTISIKEPSGTADGFQVPIPLTVFRDRTITVENLPYIVGNSAVADWYNAGDFGKDNNINNNDVNNAFHASLGLFTPFSFTDVFDAMDTFPEDSAFAVGGDGQIRFLDWQIALQRSLRLAASNWSRAWSAGGIRAATSATLSTNAANLPASVLKQAASGRVWLRHAQLEAGSLENAAPGSQISLPVYLKVNPGNKVTGMQLRAAVLPEGAAPPLRQPVIFNPNTRLTRPITLQGGQDGLPTHQAVGAWSLVQNPFAAPLENSTFLGEIQFAVPPNAQPGQSYRVRFLNADGSPDLRTQYDFETFPGVVWVGTPALRPAEAISDEWQLRFFGRLNNLLAQAEADPDEDGRTNWEEYQAGSNPVDLRFHAFVLDADPAKPKGSVRLRWFAEAGRRYQVQGSADLNSWSTLAERVGQGNVEEIVETPGANRIRFYRLAAKASNSN